MGRSKRKPSVLARALIGVVGIIAVLGVTSWLGAKVTVANWLDVNLAQLVIAILLIPVAVFAFFETLDTIRASSDRPELSLRFLGMGGSLDETYELVLPKLGGRRSRDHRKETRKGNPS